MKNNLAYFEIIYLYIGGQTVECLVRDNLIIIRDSYLVVDDELKQQVIEDLLKDFPWFNEFRSANDILNEWKVHNAFYQRGWQIARTRDTDVELKQSKMLKFAYRIASKLFKEKK